MELLRDIAPRFT